MRGEDWTCAFITCAAPNAREAGLWGYGAADPAAAFVERTRRVLAVAALHSHPSVLLGAWGCGHFRNDPTVVADAFATALDGPFAGVFETVVFAILGEASAFARRLKR